MSLLEKHFGTLAVKNGMLDLDQLQEGLNVQIEESAAGKSHRLIGVILEALGYLNEKQVAEILLTMVEE
jgi:hypothetical protein